MRVLHNRSQDPRHFQDQLDCMLGLAQGLGLIGNMEKSKLTLARWFFLLSVEFDTELLTARITRDRVECMEGWDSLFLHGPHPTSKIH